MKDIDAGLLEHYDEDVTSLATCWKATLRDSTVLGFTSHMFDLTVDGLLYEAKAGYDPTEVETSADLSVDNLDIEGLLDSPSITRDDILRGRWDHARFEIFEVNYRNLAAGKNKLRVGWLGEVKTDIAMFVAELNGLTQRLQQNVIESTSPSCRAVLGDSRCTKDLTEYTTTGAVGTVFSSRHFYTDLHTQTVRLTPSSTGNPNDTYFDRGLLTWTSGANAGASMDIKWFTQANGEITLQLPMYDPVETGDTFTAVAGCLGRIIEDCKTKFGNVPNFQGEPYKPTPTQMLKGPSRGA